MSHKLMIKLQKHLVPRQKQEILGLMFSVMNPLFVCIYDNILKPNHIPCATYVNSMRVQSHGTAREHL